VATTGPTDASAAVVLVKARTPITAIAANSTSLALRRDHRSPRFVPAA
jgi:hypothetical protein